MVFTKRCAYVKIKFNNENFWGIIWEKKELKRL